MPETECQLSLLITSLHEETVLTRRDRGRALVVSSVDPADHAARHGGIEDVDGLRLLAQDAMNRAVPVSYTHLAMQVQYGTYRDIEAWMNLVEELRGNFPGLETKESLTEHRETVLRFMKKEQALCVKAGEEIAGVLLFSKGHNMICCLGVSPAYRRRRIASSLLTAALGQLDKTREITVSTFRENDNKGTAPRALYRKFGFTEDILIEEFGYPCQKFVLRP